jgi:hypothetical protein
LSLVSEERGDWHEQADHRNSGRSDPAWWGWKASLWFGGRPGEMRSNQGIQKNKGETQPADKDRAQTAHKTSADKSASHEGTRDSKLDDHPKKSGSE